MMHGLKVCPFCGERPAVNSWQAENGKTMYIVECENRACAIRPMTDYHAKISGNCRKNKNYVWSGGKKNNG